MWVIWLLKYFHVAKNMGGGVCGPCHSIQCKEEMQLQQLTSDYKGEECVNVKFF